MLKLNVSSQFRRDRRLCGKRGYNLALLENAVDTLLVPAALPEQNRNTSLQATGQDSRNATWPRIGC